MKIWLNRIDFGVSVVDTFSTGLPEWEYDSEAGTSSAQSAERQMYAGAKFDFQDNKTSSFWIIYRVCLLMILCLV